MNRTSSSLPWCSCSTCKVHVDSCKESSFVWKRWREGGKKTKEKCVKGIFRRAPELQLCSSGKSSHQSGSKITLESNPFSEFFERCSLSLLLSRRDMGKWLCLCVCVCVLKAGCRSSFLVSFWGKSFSFSRTSIQSATSFRTVQIDAVLFPRSIFEAPWRNFPFVQFECEEVLCFLGPLSDRDLKRNLKNGFRWTTIESEKFPLSCCEKPGFSFSRIFGFRFAWKKEKKNWKKNLFPHRIIQYNFYAHTNTGSESLLAAHSWENEENKKAKKRCVYKFSWWKKGK